jgi:hypothetical protein
MHTVLFAITRYPAATTGPVILSFNNDTDWAAWMTF